MQKLTSNKEMRSIVWLITTTESSDSTVILYPCWALPANLYRSAQILTDIPGLFENWIVINSVFEKKLVG